jgi:hypothetical protein
MANAEAAITPYLEPGERILWSGIPVRGILFRREDRFLLPFGIFWLALTSFFLASAVFGVHETGGILPALPFVLIPLLFVTIGLYMVVGRFVWDADVRDRTSYALTTKRAIVFKRFPSHEFTSVGLSRATEVQTVERRDGSGTIIFGPRLVDGWPGFPRPSPNAFMFERIRDFRTTLQVVRAVGCGRDSEQEH